MHRSPPTAPLRYDATMETPEPDEANTEQGLIDSMHKILDITYKDGGHAIRSVHAKSHGLLNAELIIPDSLPDVLAQGLFARPGRYPAIMRFSTTPGDLLDDRVSTPRGLAIKVLNVEGPRLPGSEDSRTQDFVMVNGKTFGAATGKAFLGTLKSLVPTTDVAPGLKIALSSVLQVAERGLEAMGGKSGTLIALGGHPETNVLGESFFGQLPILYGPYIAKFALVPVSANLVALTGAKVELDDNPDGLRAAVVAEFAHAGGEWELRVQLATDLETTPIEDPVAVWPEDTTPFVTVARLVAAPQTGWSEPRRRAVDDGMAFSPWHGLAAHRPLGAIMRLRKRVYEMSADFRAAHNRCPVLEPGLLEDFPG